MKISRLAGIVTLLFIIGGFSPSWGERLILPLYKLAPVKTAELRCMTAETSLQIPIAERWDLKKVTLTFNYVNSTGIMPGKGRLVLSLNGYPITQRNLNPLVPEGEVTVQVPTRLFKAGYNELVFAASQHYALECEQPCAPDLWTIIKLDQAEVDIEYDLKPVPLNLGSVNDFLFDPKILPQGRVNIVVEQVSPDIIDVAGIVASGVARRFDYKKVAFTTSSTLKAGVENIVIGDSEFLSEFLEQEGLRQLEILGPYLKLMHMPAGLEVDKTGEPTGRIRFDRTHGLIIVSGTDHDQLKLAAETLTILNSSYPNSDEIVVTGFKMPDIPMYGGKMVVTPEKLYSFKTLDFPTNTFRGINPTVKEFAFRLPADLLIKPNVYVDISLYYSYGAAMRSDSALNIRLNGQIVRGINLDNPNGDLIEGYNIRIPTYMFKPGDNVLSFQAVMTSSSSHNCETLQTENLFLTIFDRSTIKFPDMPHFAELPNLALFALNGFPLTRWPDGNGSKIYLTHTGYNSITAALNIMGMITQKNGYPLFEVKFSFEDPGDFDGELILIGPADTIPEVYKARAPLSLTRESLVPYPVIRGWKNESSLAFSRQYSRFSTGLGTIMQFLSPYREGRSVIMLAAASTDDLLNLSEAVIDPVVQSQMSGDLTFVDFGKEEYEVASLSIGDSYLAGNTGEVSTVDRYLYFYPWLYTGAVISLIVVLSLILFYFLRRIRAKRQLRMSGKEEPKK